MKVVSFSFGQTSGYMLRLLMDAHPKTFDKEFKVVFENTGREHPKTLEFGHRVSTEWGVPITWLEYTRVPASTVDDSWVSVTAARYLANAKAEGRTTHWFKEVTFETAARPGRPGPFDELLDWMPVLSNVVTRACSKHLKIQVLILWLWRQGVFDYDDYVGIRKDEAHRAVEILASSPKYRCPRVLAGYTFQFVPCLEETADAVAGKNNSYENIKTMSGHPDLFSAEETEDVPCSCAVVRDVDVEFT